MPTVPGLQCIDNYFWKKKKPIRVSSEILGRGAGPEAGQKLITY